jgi:hypothetical protein
MNTVVVPLKYRFIYNEQGNPIWWEWCMKMFGPPNNSEWGIPASEHYWRLEPNNGYYTMWFSNPSHATLFRLMWS